MIVYSSSFDVSRPDGPGVNEQTFVISMARLLGDEVLFLVPEPLGSLPDEFPNSRCMFLPAVHRRKPVSWLRHQKARFTALRQIERKYAPELFILRPDIFPVSDVLFAAQSRVPYCTKNAHLSAKERRTAGGAAAMLYRTHYALLERLFRGALMIDVVSEIQRTDLLRLLDVPPERVTVTDNAVDTRRFVPLDKQACRAALRLERFNPLFGYVGNLAARRGGLELVESLPALLEHFPDSGVLIVEGDGKSAGQLQEMARQRGVQARVAIRGPVPLSEVPEYVAALDVAVSFVPDDGCSEQKVRQYIACGRPVVASAAVNQFIEAAGLGSLVRRDDAAAVAGALRRWAAVAMDPLRSTALADKLSAFARQELDTDAANRVRIARWRIALANG